MRRPDHSIGHSLVCALLAMCAMLAARSKHASQTLHPPLISQMGIIQSPGWPQAVRNPSRAGR